MSEGMGARGVWSGLLARVSTLNVAILLVILGLVLGFTTFVALAGGVSIAHHPQLQAVVFGLDFVVLALLTLVVFGRVGRMLADRRRGLAGARLHVRLITLFGIVAVAPTVVVGALAALFFHFGIQIWFSARVNTALSEARQAAAGYLQEHNANIRTEAFALANIIVSAENDEMYRNGTDLLRNSNELSQLLDSEAFERGLTEAVVFDPGAEPAKVIARGGVFSRTEVPSNPLPPPTAVAMARTNDIAIMDSADQTTVRAVVPLGDTPRLMLVITRPVDPQILAHVRKTDAVVSEYERLNANRTKIQFMFVLIFALMGMLVLAVGMLTGLILANQIVRPLGLLILAARRVSEGDLAVRVPEAAQRGGGLEVSPRRDDEVSLLSRAFNRMTDQLSAQRGELMVAYDQINERRRFTEAVLSGVSAGVIGLDARQVVELPNRAASTLLHRDLAAGVGHGLGESVPEFVPMLEAVRLDPGRVLTREVQIGGVEAATLGDGPSAFAGRTLLVRITAEQHGDAISGYVVTFDDITALLSAQRKAAWADVARRIAHEIKNPLTPIQLAAERLKRRFLKEISSDPETFSQCVDTVVRHVGDIGRMVDEFSAFARMPQPVFRDEDLSRLTREALVLQRNAHPEIVFETSEIPVSGPIVRCDRRLINQALTNLLQNAADAIAMNAKAGDVQDGPSDGAALAVTGGGSGVGAPVSGHIRVTLRIEGRMVVLGVTDDGVGLPQGDRNRLTEPYVTHKAKGTGLGLAIVKKIMEDHSGTISLADRAEGRGTVSTLTLPMREHDGA